MRVMVQNPLHPVIRIAVFIILAGGLSLGSAHALLLALALVTVTYGITTHVPLSPALKMLRRMRWLFLSLLIIYCWFTPEPLYQGEISEEMLPFTLPVSVLAWLPPLAGFQEASIRIGSLVIIILAVNLLLQNTPREHLLGAIHWWMRPLRYAGIAHDHLAIRMALVLETVPKVQLLISQALEIQQHNSNSRDPILTRTSQVAATLYQSVLTQAEQQVCHPMEIPTITSPPAWQWSLPGGLSMALWWVL